MEWATRKTKLPQRVAGGEIRRVAHARKPPVVVPVIVIAVHIQVTLVVIAIERGEMYKASSMPLPFEYS